MSHLVVRPAAPADAEAAADLIFQASAELFERYAGSAEAARRVLRAAYRSPGNTASREVVTVAEIDGRAAGAMAAFPLGEGEARARRFLRLSLRRIPPWRWPRAVGIFLRAARTTPHPPPDSLYVDALATAPPYRRRGAARALLAAAEDHALEHGLLRISLDSEAGNEPAHALYASAGFDVFERRPPGRALPGYVAFVKELV